MCPTQEVYPFPRNESDRTKQNAGSILNGESSAIRNETNNQLPFSEMDACSSAVYETVKSCVVLGFCVLRALSHGGLFCKEPGNNRLHCNKTTLQFHKRYLTVELYECFCFLALLERLKSRTQCKLKGTFLLAFKFQVSSWPPEKSARPQHWERPCLKEKCA